LSIAAAAAAAADDDDDDDVLSVRKHGILALTSLDVCY